MEVNLFFSSAKAADASGDHMKGILDEVRQVRVEAI